MSSRPALPSVSAGLVDGWNAAYFDNRLSPVALAALEALNETRADAQTLADRTFRLMRVARFDARDLSVHTAQALGAVTRSVPSAWDGAVPPITLPGRHTSTVAGDPVLTRAHFRGLLRMLLPLLPAGNDGELAEVEHQGVRLMRTPLRHYERDNLRLTHGEIGSVDIEGGVDVIRCMNVFMYFDHAFRERALVAIQLV